MVYSRSIEILFLLKLRSHFGKTPVSQHIQNNEASEQHIYAPRGFSCFVSFKSLSINTAAVQSTAVLNNGNMLSSMLGSVSWG